MSSEKVPLVLDSKPIYDDRPPRKSKKDAAIRTDNVGYRLALRKDLFRRRRVTSDLALALAVAGIFLMIVETELYMGRIYQKTDFSSYFVKGCISVSTIILLLLVMWYHVLNIKLFMCDNSVQDWTLAMTGNRFLGILLELVICSIHPFPGNNEMKWTTLNPQTHQIHTAMVPIDVYLAIPMFFRFYLFCRVMMLHSKLFTDASSQSLGALNRIQFNFSFIFKSMMTLYPENVLLVLFISVFFMNSWLLRACEMYQDDDHTSFLNSMWVIVITFLTVGYGDLYPISYCGRVVAVMTGIFGAGCTALVVAVLANKLELSRTEKYVHNFVLDIELDKRYKHAAADVLKAGWFVYKHRTDKKTIKLRRYQRKLLKAIHTIRDVKEEQSRLKEFLESGEDGSGEGMAEVVSKLQAIENKIDTLAEAVGKK